MKDKIKGYRKLIEGLKWNWITFLLFATPAFKMYLMQQFDLLDNVFDLWGILAVAAMFLMLLIRKANVKIEMLYMIGFLGIYMLSTILNDRTQMVSAVSEISRILILPMYLLLVEKDGITAIRKTLSQLRIVCLGVLAVDIAVTLLEVLGVPIFSSKIYSVIGMDNYAIYSIIPMLTLVLLSSVLEAGKIQRIDMLVFAAATVSKILTKSVMAIIVLLIFAAVIILLEYKDSLIKWVTPRNAAVLIFLAVFGVVFFQIQYVFKPILDLLGKGVTLNYRTVIWEKTVNGLAKSPIIGFGKCTGNVYKTIVGFPTEWESQATHPHNFILSILFSAGILGLVIYAAMIFKCFKKVWDIKLKRAIIVVNAGLISFIVLGFADDYIMLPFFYTILTCVLILSDKQENVKIRKKGK